MAHKVFISYKYKDADVYPLEARHWAIYGEPTEDPTTVRDYVNVLQNYFYITDSAKNKGERDDEDLSNLSDDAIWEKLKPRIYDSTVTIVMISPNMKDVHRCERSQWIPQEISYSLKEMTRNDRTSHSNAMLALVLPDKNKSYSYYENDDVFYDGFIYGGDNVVFDIIRKNMFNKKNVDFRCVRGTMRRHSGDSSYIKTVYWDDFVESSESIQKYINHAIEIKNRIDEYEIKKEVQTYE